MKKQKETVQHQPLLFIKSVNHVISKTCMQTTFITPKKKLYLDNLNQRQPKVKPFHLLSLEEKLNQLKYQPDIIAKKMCKIGTENDDIIGKIVDFQDERVVVETPFSTENQFILASNINVLDIIGI